MNVEINYKFKDELGRLQEGTLYITDVIQAILDKEGKEISSIQIYSSKVEY